MRRLTPDEVTALSAEDYMRIRGDLLDDGVLNDSHTPNEGVERLEWHPGVASMSDIGTFRTEREAAESAIKNLWKRKQKHDADLQELNGQIKVNRARLAAHKEMMSAMGRPPECSAASTERQLGWDRGRPQHHIDALVAAYTEERERIKAESNRREYDRRIKAAMPYDRDDIGSIARYLIYGRPTHDEADDLIDRMAEIARAR